MVLNPVPLEDELGDVIEKAMRRRALNLQELSQRAGVPAGTISDAINYRPELTANELARIAGVLGLNEVGLCALGCGRYPLPELNALSFCVHPLRMQHGIGVANAYIVSECGASRGILFDSGPNISALKAVWPPSIRHLDAIFLTHSEGEHAGGLCEAMEVFGASAAYCPFGTNVACAAPLGEGGIAEFHGFKVTAFSTPGHAPAHNCYLVESTVARAGAPLLVSGDLFFAGSVGCAHYCHDQLAANLKRMLKRVPSTTTIAPGHGPMTTAANELKYNPFVV